MGKVAKSFWLCVWMPCLQKTGPHARPAALPRARCIESKAAPRVHGIGKVICLRMCLIVGLGFRCVCYFLSWTALWHFACFCLPIPTHGWMLLFCKHVQTDAIDTVPSVCIACKLQELVSFCNHVMMPWRKGSEQWSFAWFSHHSFPVFSLQAKNWL